MVEASQSEDRPYRPEDVGVLLTKRQDTITDELRIEYLLRQGVVRWAIEQGSSEYPTKKFWDRVLGMNKEYRNPAEFWLKYVERMIEQGDCSEICGEMYIVNGEVGLEFAVTGRSWDTVKHPVGIELSLHNIHLRYHGWCESHLVPTGDFVRKPDVIHFSQMLVTWDFIRELFDEKD